MRLEGAIHNFADEIHSPCGEYILRLLFTATELEMARASQIAYGLVKIENRSRNRSHKLDGIGVGRIRTFPFFVRFRLQLCRLWSSENQIQCLFNCLISLWCVIVFVRFPLCFLCCKLRIQYVYEALFWSILSVVQSCLVMQSTTRHTIVTIIFMLT